ncbi:hypothetical protein FLM48_05065 [Shewanella sp. Scap07]|nr:hypothetical protein [Shewanella sp. Scap07]QLE84516.1 hypothetical protein FLM48_05065 [Shewanella sp. Scap07]
MNARWIMAVTAIFLAGCANDISWQLDDVDANRPEPLVEPVNPMADDNQRILDDARERDRLK